MPKPSRRRRRRILLWTAIPLLLFALVFGAFYRGLVIRRYAVSSAKLGGEPIRVVLLADLHSYIYAPDQEPIIRRVARLQPDVIILDGDMADDRNPLTGFDMLLNGISSLAPCYYVTGSHDYWSGEIDRVKAAVAGYGVTVLEGQTAELSIRGQRISISGIDDPVMLAALDGEGSDDACVRLLHAFFNDLDRGEYNILVIHRPDFTDVYRELGFDLVLSGHTHGGQVRIPFLLNGLFAPDQGYWPKYAGGLYTLGSTRLVVSRGLSYYPELPRIFNPPEIVLIELKAE